LAAGTVEMVGGDRVRLVATSYQPLAGTEEQLAYLARNGADFLSAAAENVMGADPAHFERAVHYNGLSAAAVETLRQTYAARQMAVLEAINAEAARLQETDPGQWRFRAGGYFYQTEEQ
jgi:hypothetical protein